MRRGIASLQYLPALALVLLTGAMLAMPLILQWEVSQDPYERGEYYVAVLEARDRTFRPSMGVNLRNSVLTHCRIAGPWQHANMRGCEFWECDLRDANLQDVDLSGCVFDRFTRWPDGFDPQAHGARLDE